MVVLFLLTRLVDVVKEKTEDVNSIWQMNRCNGVSLSTIRKIMMERRRLNFFLAIKAKHFSFLHEICFS